MDKNKRLTVWLPVIIAASIALGIFIGNHYLSISQGKKRSYSSGNKINAILDIIDEQYVDTVSMSKLVESTIPKIFSELDPHSVYIPAEDASVVNEELEGSFSGIGVSFNMQTDTILVISVISGGPAEKAGLLPFDRIISINDSIFSGKKKNQGEIMKTLRGAKNSTVKLGVQRGNSPELLYFDVTRGDVPVNSVDVSYEAAKGIGYIKVSKFARNTYNEFITAIAKLKQAGCTSFVIDLRGNTGGYMDAATGIASEFLPKNDLIVYTKGLRTPYKEFRAQGPGLFREGRIIVLVDEYSASASEIVTGAIQDQDRGLVVGRRTFGKGLVQKPFVLPDGSMIRLTVARYYTPSGRCIQKPYTMGDKMKYNMDVIERYNHGELTNADSIHFPDSLKYKTLRKGRTVYGGGGIMPDYFIPLDTTRYTKFHRELTAKGAIVNADLKFIDKYRKKIRREYASFDKFKTRFETPQELIDLVLAEGEKAGVKPKDEEELQKTLPELKLQMKALIARDIWDMSEYFAVMYEENPFVKKALELLEQ